MAEKNAGQLAAEKRPAMGGSITYGKDGRVTAAAGPIAKHECARHLLPKNTPKAESPPPAQPDAGKE